MIMNKMIPVESKVKSRLTRLQTTCLERPHEDPVVIETRTSVEMGSDEQPFIRHMDLTDKWVEIEQGWVSNPSLVCIKPRLPTRNLIPPREEQERMKEVVVEIGYAPPASADRLRTMHDPVKPQPIGLFEVQFGDQQSMVPKNLKLLRIRVSQGTAKCVVTVFP